MRKVALPSVALSVVALATLSGCSSEPKPAFASAANESSYAEHYPASLAARRTGYAADEAHARETFGAFSNYPSALSAPDGQQVLAVVTRADAAGKSGSFAVQMDEQSNVSAFFSDEKDTLNQKVGGAAAYAAKQKECTADVASPAVGALDHGIEKAQQDRLRRHNEAQRYIEDHQDALGKANLEKLQKQADDIALASYLVHVRVKEIKVELTRLVAEASAVKKTLAQSDADAQVVLSSATASKSAKATAQTRSTAAKTATTGLDSEVDQAKQALKDMDARSDKLEKDYSAALDSLEKTLNNLPKKT
ncbi:MAG: hypothetical protein ABI548_21760 [Polyangiaceae bacterium]